MFEKCLAPSSSSGVICIWRAMMVSLFLCFISLAAFSIQLQLCLGVPLSTRALMVYNGIHVLIQSFCIALTNYTRAWTSNVYSRTPQRNIFTTSNKFELWLTEKCGILHIIFTYFGLPHKPYEFPWSWLALSQCYGIEYKWQTLPHIGKVIMSI